MAPLSVVSRFRPFGSSTARFEAPDVTFAAFVRV
jgi:hypothetical protein